MELKGIFICLVIIGLYMASVEAARRVDARLRAQTTMHRRRQSAMNRREMEPLETTNLFELTEGESLENVREMPDAIGTKVERLKEKYKGIEVYDSVVTVRKDKTGQLTGDATGTLIQGIDKDLPDTTPALSDEETIAIAAKSEGDDLDSLTNVNCRQQIFIDKKDKARLVNIVSYLVDGVKRPFVIVDSNDGTILKKWQGLTTYPCCDKGKYHGVGGNTKIGKITYGNMPYCLSPTINGSICYLENEYVRVVDMLNSQNDTIVETASFECAKGYDDPVNDAYSPALDAFFYGTVVGKMFEEWFGSTALDDKIVIRVHFGDLYPNAFWNGENATFGDGWYDMFPFTTLDIVGHEIGHGVTEQGSGLEYYDEQGGVNEAFSDIFGEAAEDYLLKSDFYTGYDVMKHIPYLREFENPTSDNSSIGHVDEMEDDTNPHYSSGVYRRVWYVVVKENGMSIRDAAEVFLYANRLYWHSSASFYDVSCGLLQAAIDLGVDTVPFRLAFSDVGMKSCDVKAHVYGLNNNETQENVTVSDTINPTFKFETPEWADSVLVSARGTKDEDVKITVLKGGWETSAEPCKETDAGTVIAEGVSFLTIDNAADVEYFITLSPVSDIDGALNGTETYSTTLHVDVTVGYTCLEDWYGDFIQRWFYADMCGLDPPSYD